jgi:hypothetical protein
MSEDKIITISNELWLIPESDYLILRDNASGAGGETLIEFDEIVPLLDALQAIRVARNIK